MALRRSFATVLVVLALVAVASLPAQDGTRGVGVYPGDPQQDFGPLLVPGGPEHRNLALRRAASASSSYDDNLTAQLVTDGIRQARLPRWLATATSEQGVAGRVERELLVDDNVVSTVTLERPPAWLQLELGGGDAPLEIDRIELQATLRRHPMAALLAAQRPEGASGQWTCIVRGSDDGRTWQELGRAAGPLPASFDPPRDAGFAAWWWRGPAVTPSVALTPAAHSRFYRIALEPAGLLTWTVSELKLFDRDKRVEVGGPYDFTSAWMSAGSGRGVGVRGPGGAAARSTAWRSTGSAARPKASIQVPTMPGAGATSQPLPATSGLDDDDLKLAQPVKAPLRARADDAARLARRLHPERAGSLRARRAGAAAEAGAAPCARTAGWTWPAAPGECSAIRWSAPTARRSRSPASRTRTGWSPPCPARCSPATRTPARFPIPNFGDNQLDDLRLVLLRRFLVSQRVHGAAARRRASTSG